MINIYVVVKIGIRSKSEFAWEGWTSNFCLSKIGILFGLTAKLREKVKPRALAGDGRW
jgi:hypothetical protein